MKAVPKQPGQSSEERSFAGILSMNQQRHGETLTVIPTMNEHR
jgi:hypothetical protein